MPSIEFNEDKKGNLVSIFLRDVALFYVRCQKPQPIKEQKDWSNPNRFEYSVSAAVTEEIADQWDEIFAKQGSKKMTNAKFKERYKLEEDQEVPYPDEKKQYMLDIKQKTHKSNGEKISAKMRPRVVQNIDGENVDVTMDKLVGNGSRGDILIRVSHNKEYGTFAHLGLINVTDMIEYETEGADSDVNDFLGGNFKFADIDDDDDDNGRAEGSAPSDGEGFDDDASGNQEPAPSFDDDDDDDDFM